MPPNRLTHTLLHWMGWHSGIITRYHDEQGRSHLTLYCTSCGEFNKEHRDRPAQPLSRAISQAEAENILSRLEWETRSGYQRDRPDNRARLNALRNPSEHRRRVNERLEHEGFAPLDSLAERNMDQYASPYSSLRTPKA
jgi:hypothetical protein